MLLCCDDLAWMLGKIVKYKPRARVFNFDMQWKADTTQQHGVKLAAYHQQGRDAEAGSWLYLKKLCDLAHQGARARRRRQQRQRRWRRAGPGWWWQQRQHARARGDAPPVPRAPWVGLTGSVNQAVVLSGGSGA